MAAGAEAVEDIGTEESEVVIFQLKECYVYKIPPRKSAASYRADEWDINKWAWEGAMRVVSKGDICTILLEDAKSGELFAQAPVRPDQPVPVEAVIDSSRFFVLRIEDNSGGGGGGGQQRHAFIGLGFRERPQAYDFQAAIYDHVKYLNKKKEAEEMEAEYQSKPAVDYSLKEGQTLRLDLKGTKSSFFKPRPISDRLKSPATPGAIPAPGALPPPPGTKVVPIRHSSGEHGPSVDAATSSPSSSSPLQPSSLKPTMATLKVSNTNEREGDVEENGKLPKRDASVEPEKKPTADVDDEDFGDFQEA